MTPRALIVAVLLAFVATGCGVGPGERGTGVEVTVTRDFGAEKIAEVSEDDAPENDTIMRLLQRRFDVEVRFGGGFVQQLEGIEGGTDRGRPVDWFFYVNGIESDEGAAARKISDGDRIWWDHHDWGGAMRTPAVVGSFPEPFRSGVGGKRLPVRIDCASDAERACDEVSERLTSAGVTRLARAGIGQTAGREVVRMLVGTWEQVRQDPAVESIAEGPDVSGVYVRIRGERMELLDPRGGVDRVLGPGAGLVAATRFEEQQPTWVVTGIDAVGVAAAAAALVPDVLESKFAVAIDEGRAVGLPVTEAPQTPEAE